MFFCAYLCTWGAGWGVSLGEGGAPQCLLKDAALGVSARHGEAGGQDHVLDPRSGSPAGEVEIAAVIAEAAQERLDRAAFEQRYGAGAGFAALPWKIRKFRSTLHFSRQKATKMHFSDAFSLKMTEV